MVRWLTINEETERDDAQRGLGQAHHGARSHPKTLASLQLERVLFFSVGFVPDFFSAAIVSDHKFFGFGTETKFRLSRFSFFGRSGFRPAINFCKKIRMKKMSESGFGRCRRDNWQKRHSVKRHFVSHLAFSIVLSWCKVVAIRDLWTLRH